MPTITFIHDLTDPADSNGRSYKEVNLEKSHNIPMGSLVELDGEVRLFVVNHGRDCDGTPLYYLCANKDNTVHEREGFMNRKWCGGYSEDSLKIVK